MKIIGDILEVTRYDSNGRPLIIHQTEEGITNPFSAIFGYKKSNIIKPETIYTVRGQCFDLVNNKVMYVWDEFETIEESKAQFNELINLYPQSHIHIMRTNIEGVESYT